MKTKFIKTILHYLSIKYIVFVIIQIIIFFINWYKCLIKNDLTYENVKLINNLIYQLIKNK